MSGYGWANSFNWERHGLPPVNGPLVRRSQYPDEDLPDDPDFIPALSGSSIQQRARQEAAARNEVAQEQGREERRQALAEHRRLQAEIVKNSISGEESGLPPLPPFLEPGRNNRKDPHGHVIQYWDF